MTFWPFLFLNVFLLFVVHNCKNEAINVTKSDFFYNHFIICNPKFCINQAIKVTEGEFIFIFLILLLLISNAKL